MSIYVAPLKDMQFVIEELVGLADITAMPACAEVTPDLVEAVLNEAGKFAAEVLDPLNRVGDTQGARLADGRITPPAGFAEAYQQFIAAGWNGLSGPVEFGGQGLPHIVAMAVQEMWNSANMAFCLCPMLTSGVIEALKLSGSPEQKQRFLPKLVAGEWSGTMNLTEPQAGSDLVRRAHASGAGGRSLPHQGHQDFHHLGRARHVAEHRASGARAHARRARGRQGHFAVHRAEVSRQCRRFNSARATTSNACRSSTRWASTRARPA